MHSAYYFKDRDSKSDAHAYKRIRVRMNYNIILYNDNDPLGAEVAETNNKTIPLYCLINHLLGATVAEFEGNVLVAA